MSLILSAAELARLESAQSAIVSRLATEDPAAWRAAVTYAMRDLVGADHATLFESGPAPVAHLSTHDESATHEYLAHYVHRDPVTSALAAREIECGCAWDVIAPGEFRRTAFYNDYVRRHSLYDGMGYRIQVGADSHAWLTFHFEREHEEEDAHRRTALLRLLLPAFRAAMQVDRRLVAWSEDAFRSIDAQSEGILLCTPEGRVVHVNPALQRILAAEPDGEAIHDALVGLARGLTASPVGSPLRVTTRQLRTPQRRYVAVAMQAGAHLAPAGAVVVLRPLIASDDELRQQFGLTTREAEVARLLAQGRRNAEVARELGISVFTARRHTERVLLKLRVDSRAQVASRMGV